jgi:hypothetical protein
MSMTERTITILRNFATINPSIQFKTGKVLKTVSPNKTVLAVADIEEDIQHGFAIYDLSRFLGTLSLFEKPEMEFSDNKVTIKAGKQKVDYMFADPSTLVLPPEKELSIGDNAVKCTLKGTQLAEMFKALGILSLPELCVVGENGKILIRATDTKDNSSDKFDVEVGETDKEFTAVFKTENLKLLPGDYEISINPGISFWKGNMANYFIAVESNSSF